MQLLKGNTNIDFMGARRPAVGVSVLLVVVSIVALLVNGLNFGLEFTGGVVIEVGYDEPVELENVRARLADAGYSEATVQSYGSASEVLIRMPPVETSEEAAELASSIVEALRADDSSARMLRPHEFVGPQVGSDLAEQGTLAMLIAIILIFIYIMFRFRWKFGVGAVLALAHDAIITVGFFALTGYTVDLSVLAAVLAVIGYSLNDQVVIYDRIRENFHLMRRSNTYEIVNASLNQTLSRTIMTAVTTLLVLVALISLAGDTLFGFSVALIVGVVIGTYSSIYMGGATVLWLNVSPTDMLPPKREEVDELP